MLLIISNMPKNIQSLILNVFYIKFMPCIVTSMNHRIHVCWKRFCLTLLIDIVNDIFVCIGFVATEWTIMEWTTKNKKKTFFFRTISMKSFSPFDRLKKNINFSLIYYLDSLHTSSLDTFFRLLYIKWKINWFWSIQP